MRRAGLIVASLATAVMFAAGAAALAHFANMPAEIVETADATNIDAAPAVERRGGAPIAAAAVSPKTVVRSQGGGASTRGRSDDDDDDDD